MAETELIPYSEIENRPKMTPVYRRELEKPDVVGDKWNKTKNPGANNVQSHDADNDGGKE